MCKHGFPRYSSFPEHIVEHFVYQLRPTTSVSSKPFYEAQLSVSRRPIVRSGARVACNNRRASANSQNSKNFGQRKKKKNTRRSTISRSPSLTRVLRVKKRTPSRARVSDERGGPTEGAGVAGAIETSESSRVTRSSRRQRAPERVVRLLRKNVFERDPRCRVCPMSPH